MIHYVKMWITTFLVIKFRLELALLPRYAKCILTIFQNTYGVKYGFGASAHFYGYLHI